MRKVELVLRAHEVDERSLLMDGTGAQSSHLFARQRAPRDQHPGVGWLLQGHDSAWAPLVHLSRTRPSLARDGQDSGRDIQPEARQRLDQALLASCPTTVTLLAGSSLAEISSGEVAELGEGDEVVAARRNLEGVTVSAARWARWTASLQLTICAGRPAELEPGRPSAPRVAGSLGAGAGMVLSSLFSSTTLTAGWLSVAREKGWVGGLVGPRARFQPEDPGIPAMGCGLRRPSRAAGVRSMRSGGGNESGGDARNSSVGTRLPPEDIAFAPRSPVLVPSIDLDAPIGIRLVGRGQVAGFEPPLTVCVSSTLRGRRGRLAGEPEGVGHEAPPGGPSKASLGYRVLSPARGPDRRSRRGEGEGSRLTDGETRSASQMAIMAASRSGDQRAALE